MNNNDSTLRHVQFSRSVMSNYLQPQGLQHARLPCPSPSPGICSNSCPSSRWCHPTISSSVVLFSSCLQSFPASGSFLISQFFSSGGQSIGVSASASVLPMNIQDWSPLGWTGWISLQSKGLSRVFSNTTVRKHQFFSTQLSFMVQLSYPYTTTGKTITLTRRTFVVKVMSQLFNMLFGFVMASLVAQRLKNLPAVWETQFWSLGWEDPLEKEMATHSSTLAWKVPWMEEPGRLQSRWWQRVGHDWETSLGWS